MTSDPVVPRGDGALVRLRVSPNAKSTGLRGLYGEAALKLKVAAPPVEGKANAEVERLLAEKTGASPSRVRVVRGLSGRDKTVFVDGVGAERVREVRRSRPR
ncbi:MAG TPA: DUF167 domain-containing protein [Rubrobacter sp.]|nr:DUF167 domain-containing protein [Rubrobacter sp.]